MILIVMIYTNKPIYFLLLAEVSGPLTPDAATGLAMAAVCFGSAPLCSMCCCAGLGGSSLNISANSGLIYWSIVGAAMIDRQMKNIMVYNLFLKIKPSGLLYTCLLYTSRCV